MNFLIKNLGLIFELEMNGFLKIPKSDFLIKNNRMNL